MKKKKFCIFVLLAAMVVLAFYSNAFADTLENSENNALDQALFDEYEDTPASYTLADPFYYFNYAMYSFNDILYFAVLKPVATGFKAVTPTPLRIGLKNFFYNLVFPVRFVNNILQGKIRDAGTEAEIFLINSTLGVLGFAQVAQNEFDLKSSREDLGQTLGSYSIGNGFYLVWPVLGPSTFRDTVGLVGDYFLTPLNYVEPWQASAGIKGVDTINSTSFRLGDYEALKAAALDPYQAIKNAYLQNRMRQLDE
jgi:phospholipid-binding lipoprotein MlaA